MYKAQRTLVRAPVESDATSGAVRNRGGASPNDSPSVLTLEGGECDGAEHLGVTSAACCCSLAPDQLPLELVGMDRESVVSMDVPPILPSNAPVWLQFPTIVRVAERITTEEKKRLPGCGPLGSGFDRLLTSREIESSSVSVHKNISEVSVVKSGALSHDQCSVSYIMILYGVLTVYMYMYSYSVTS